MEVVRRLCEKKIHIRIAKRAFDHIFSNFLVISGSEIPFWGKNVPKNPLAKYPQNNSIIVVSPERFLRC